MSQPITREDLAELGARLEKRFDTLDQNHQELMLAVADVVTRVNDHVDERLDRLEGVLAMKDRLDRIEVLLTEQFGRDVLARAGL